MPGFPTEEQVNLASLVGNHRGKIDWTTMATLQGAWAKRTRRLTILLRLAVLFNRSRILGDLSAMKFRAKGDRLSIEIPEFWLQSNRLTLADLEREQIFLGDVGIELELIGESETD